jgi:hypothetical protein
MYYFSPTFYLHFTYLSIFLVYFYLVNIPYRQNPDPSNYTPS